MRVEISEIITMKQIFIIVRMYIHAVILSGVSIVVAVNPFQLFIFFSDVTVVKSIWNASDSKWQLLSNVFARVS